MGSTRNGRDSESKRLGAKRPTVSSFWPGNILVRQRGTKIHPGTNVGIGGDDTLYALVDGTVKFERMGKDRKKVSVYEIAAVITQRDRRARRSLFIFKWQMEHAELWICR